VNTQFNGNGTTCPIYSLGASLVRKEWLLQVPFDEVLDRHGIGDNYGVACELPGSIHIVSKAKAYHHQETINRLNKPVQYYRRILALDYFIKTRKRLVHVKRRKLLWSLTGNFLSFLVAGKFRYCKATLKSMWLILFNRNPYVRGARKEIKTIEPQL
jgi:hypothetical protein